MMTNAARLFYPIALAMILSACSDPVSPSPSSPVQVDSPLGSLRGKPSPSSLPAWITEPATLPDGRVGKNNCTFPFPLDYQWDSHPEGAAGNTLGRTDGHGNSFKRPHPQFSLLR
jgi:hypothetical protein